MSSTFNSFFEYLAIVCNLLLRLDVWKISASLLLVEEYHELKATVYL